MTLQKAATAARQAREIAEKASTEDRPMTTGEKADFDRLFARARDLKADQDVLDRIGSIAAEIGLSDDIKADVDSRPKLRAGVSTGAKAAHRIREVGGPDAVKALITDTVNIPTTIETEIELLPRDPRRLLDLITGRTISGTNTFSWFKQTARENNAAPVADGALKPTSRFNRVTVEDRLRVIAHLSEPMPERFLEDEPELERFLAEELDQGLLDALEAQLMSGDGEFENMTGLMATSGTVAVPFAVDPITTARKAVTQLEVLREQPTAWMMNPEDGEAFDLERENGDGTGAFLMSQGAPLWRLPRVHTPALPVGTAVLGDFRQMRLVQSGQITLKADRSADNFRRNQVELRVEGRFGFAVLRPQAFAIVDLAGVV